MPEMKESTVILMKRAEDGKARVRKVHDAINGMIQYSENLDYRVQECLTELLATVRHLALTDELIIIELEHIQRRIDLIHQHRNR
jgi:hypothetical protein